VSDLVKNHAPARLHHVAISVGDKSIAEMVDWYRRTLGCEVAYQDETWAMLQFANVQVALVMPGQHPPHLGFETPEAERFGELRTHRDGTRSIYIPDPAGNPVEMMAPAEVTAE
jgi:catechol-2,3-dioxygenase